MGILARDYCHVDTSKNRLFILLWHFVAVHRLFYKLQSISFSYGSYIEQIMLCKKENSVQIAKLVILEADQRSRLRCHDGSRLPAFTRRFGEYKLYFSNKTNSA